MIVYFINSIIYNLIHIIIQAYIILLIVIQYLKKLFSLLRLILIFFQETPKNREESEGQKS